MGEDMSVFKSFLRSLKRQLLLLQKAIEDKDFDAAAKLIDEIIQDTQDGIEDN